MEDVMKDVAVKEPATEAEIRADERFRVKTMMKVVGERLVEDAFAGKIGDIEKSDMNPMMRITIVMAFTEHLRAIEKGLEEMGSK